MELGCFQGKGCYSANQILAEQNNIKRMFGLVPSQSILLICRINNPQLAPIKPTQYTHEDVEVIIGQDYYHAVRPIEFVLGDDKSSSCSVCLPIDWVISGPLSPSVASTSSCFKCVVQDSSLTDQIKSW